MTDTTTTGKSLDGMLLAELKHVAGSLGLKGTAGMRKGELVGAIKAAQGSSSENAAPARRRPTTEERPAETAAAPATDRQHPQRHRCTHGRARWGRPVPSQPQPWCTPRRRSPRR